MEPAWNIGDGFLRWCRGISQARYLVALIQPEVLAYVSGCHIKYVNLSLPTCEVTRMFHPGMDGIELLEAKPTQSIFALAEKARQPRISVYRFDNNQDFLISELKGGAENRYRAIRFNDNDILLGLSGVPELCISMWRWTSGEQLMVVNCLEKGYESDLLISGVNNDIWVEWSQNYITFYELVTFINKTTVVRSDITLPPNEAAFQVPDPRVGDPYKIDIISVVFAFNGIVFVLDQLNGLHTVSAEDKVLVQVGKIDISDEGDDVTIEYIVPYSTCVAAVLSSGTVLVLQIQDGQLKVKSRMEFSSRIRKYIQNTCAAHPFTSFYAITDVKKVENVLDGKMRAPYTILDLTLSEIQYVCFIGKDAAHVAVVSEIGGVYILDSNTGNIFTKWKLPFYAESIISHPLLPIVAIGTADGCIIYLDIREIQAPQIIHRSFLCEDTEIDKLAWTCRGRYLIAGDSQRRHLFLTYGLPSMDFHYLDYSSLSGSIRAINTPVSYKDKRLQVVLQENDFDEVPFQVNNYRLDAGSLELVASQLLDSPIKTLCFSSLKKLMYSYTCEHHCVGMIYFTDEMHAGSLKEPEILFDGDLPLHVNRMILVGDKIYTFGEDGYVMQHLMPAPKDTALHTEEVLQTHFPSYEGIKDGFLSMNGCRFLAIGYDNTIVHVLLKPEDEKINWGLLGYGLDMDNVVQAQMIYLERLDLEKNVEIGDEEVDFYMQAVNDEKLTQKRRNEVEVKVVHEGLEELKKKIRRLIQLNSNQPLPDQLSLDEFELDDDNEEIEAKECEQDKQIAEIIVTSFIDERNKWAGTMKDLMWNAFEVKISKVMGFNIKREISNYPLRPMGEDVKKELEIIKHQRRIEKKLFARDIEVQRARQDAITKVIQLRKKRKVKQRKVDLSKYPPHMRDEMRQMIKDMPYDSDSDYDSGPTGNKLSMGLSSTAIFLPGTDDEQKDDGDLEPDKQHELSLDEDEALFESETEEEGEQVDVKRESIRSEGNTSEGSQTRRESGASQRSSKSHTLSTGSGEDETGDSEGEEEETGTGRHKSKSKKFTLDPIREAVWDDDDDEEEEEVEEVELPELDDYELEQMYPDVVYDPTKEIKKKRRFVLKKVADDDDDTMVLVEEDDSSDDSDSDVERQMKVEESRAREKERRQRPTERHRNKILNSLYSGSLTCEFFDTDANLYEQLDLSAFHEMHSQINILGNEIRKLKTTFNDTFEELKQIKISDVDTIKSRNERIREIAEFFEICIDVKDPVPEVFEVPETIFHVTDEENCLEKYMTPEERRLAELARLEAEALRHAKKDDFYERALIVMMDGVLERRREDVVRQEILKPLFMITNEQWEWSHDECEQAKEYYKKVEELEQLRQEYRKETENELRVLLQANADTKNQFDDRLRKLHDQKLNIDLSIRMEEVKLSRMVRQIMKRYDLEREETRLNNALNKYQDTTKTSHVLATELRARAEDCTFQYNTVLEKDKFLERNFQASLGEIGHFYDSFAKLYKKRPKIDFTHDKNGELMKLMIRALGTTGIKSSEYENIPNCQGALEAIYKLDDSVQTPTGCPRSTWERFCRLRHEKIICEYEAKVIADELNILHNILHSFKGRESEGLRVIATVLADLSRQRDLKLSHIHNAEFQMVIRQGQIELPRDLVRRDFYNALLLRKILVEACNTSIRKFGRLKAGALQKSKNQHLTVKQLEWKYKKVQFKEKHAQKELHDINTFRLTKDVLDYLRTTDDFNQERIRRLENVHRLHDQIQKFHEKLLDKQGYLLRKLETSIADFEQDSKSKKEEVVDRNLDVSDKRMTCNVENMSQDLQIHRERIFVIMRNAYMMRQIAKNAEEIFCLETELDRLYKKTFPIL